MTTSSRLSALIAYLPIVGWIFVGIFRQKDAYAMFHLRQSIGLGLFLGLVGVGWAVAAWAIAWIPYAFIVSMGLFALVILALLLALIAWVFGIIYALQGRKNKIPFAGDMINFLSSLQS